MISIRRATLSDLKNIHDIETLSFKHGSYPLFVLRQLFDISGDYFLVAEENTKIMGYALGNLVKNTAVGWVLSLGVHPDARRKQIGNTLTEKLVGLLENHQSKEIQLTVHPHNNAAIKIYQNLGFKIAETSNNYYFDNEKRLLMIKSKIVK